MTTALMAGIFAAVYLSQLYGIQMHAFIKPKLDNAAFARESLMPLIDEIRCAQSVEVGNGSWSSFVTAGSTNARSGNALRIYLAGDTNRFIYYFRDSGTETFRRTPWGGSNSVKVAESVTNAVIFRLEDFRGTLLTNSQNQTVLDVMLQMRQPAFNYRVDDSYQVHTKISRRATL